MSVVDRSRFPLVFQGYKASFRRGMKKGEKGKGMRTGEKGKGIRKGEGPLPRPLPVSDHKGFPEHVAVVCFTGAQVHTIAS